MKNNLIVKHNKLIEANYKLTLQEQKLILILAQKINKGDLEFKKYAFTTEELSEILELNKKSYYSELKEVTKKLMSRVIQIKEPNELLQVTWLNSAKYYENEGTVELGFSNDLKPYLLQLGSHFTKLEFNKMVSLNSVYAVRIYELLKQYEIIRERTITLKELKEILEIKVKSYNIYNNLKRRIILKAKEEINEKTDLLIDFEEIKTGRKVTAIKFRIAKKEKIKLEITELRQKEYSKEVLELFKVVKKTEKTESIKELLEKLLKKYSYEVVRSNISYSNKKSDTNYQAYLSNALNSDYAKFEREKISKKKEIQKEQEIQKKEYLEKSEKINIDELTETEKKYLERANKIAEK